jgi:tRNA(Ile)-lysidine synthase
VTAAEGAGAASHAALVAAVRAALRGVLPEGAHAGVAVSGGPDSVALALLVAAARPDLRLQVLHVRHGLRDDRADAAAAAALARRLGLPCAIAQVEVGRGAGPEAAARTARHAALRRLAARHGLDAILLGHTADDQAETVLLNLVRGAGLRGVAGMRPVRVVAGVTLIRPLLLLRRADVAEVPAAAGVAVVHDPSNDDLEQRRGRARREVLPALARLAGGPGDPVAALARFACLAAADEDLLHEHAEAATRALVGRVGPVALVPHAALMGLPLALRRRVVRGLVQVAVAGAGAGVAVGNEGGEGEGVDVGVGAGDPVTPPAADVEAVLALAPGAVITLAGAVPVARSQGWLTVGGVPRVGAAEAGGAAGTRRALQERTTHRGTVLEVVVRGAGPAPAEPAHRDDAGAGAWRPVPVELALAAPPRRWSVRAVAPGDVLRCGGRDRALRELARQRGVPRAVREVLPVLLDDRGTLQWVPGVGVRDGLGGTVGGRVALRFEPAERHGRLGYPPDADPREPPAGARDWSDRA